MLAIDTAEGTLDIAVPGFAVPVALTYSGAFAGETGRSELFVEDTQNGVQAGAVDLFDFPVDPEASEMSGQRSEEHTSELQSLMRISYAVFCLKNKRTTITEIRL